MDAGVIQAFKLYYRRQQVAHLIDAIDSNQSTKLHVSDAIRYAKRAWDMISSETIHNCFRHTGILPPEWNNSQTSSRNIDTFSIPRNLFERIAEEFNIDKDMLMNEDEFVSCDKQEECSQVMTDSEII